MEKAKPAEGIGGHREIRISDWKPHSKNTLVGFFSAALPSGMVLHNLMLHEKGEARWIGLPAREWTNDQGIKQFAKLIEFTTGPPPTVFAMKCSTRWTGTGRHAYEAHPRRLCGVGGILDHTQDRGRRRTLPATVAGSAGVVGTKRRGDFSGIVFPYRWPGETYSMLDRLRLDHPPIDVATRKVEHKYLTAYGTRNRLYFPPCDPPLLADPTLPVIITEGEKKGLALWRLALQSNGTGKPAFLPVALPGVWSFRSTVGARENAQGERVPEKGFLPDFDRIAWAGRRITILFDANAATNPKVQAAPRELARELTRRGAEVWIADLPDAPGVNGVDDCLGVFGLAKALEVLKLAVRYDWRKELIRSDKDKVLPIFANAVTALRCAPEWSGVLAYDQFALSVVALRETPWGIADAWSDQDDRRATEWLQRAGIMVKLTETGQAVQTVAGDHAFHPVREYLDGLEWDKISRIDDWLRLYAGVDPTDLTRAIGARWLISGVARIYEPGCKVDCCLILEGPQSIGKSTALSILGGEWYSDDLAQLGNKDAALGTRGKWIIELAELDSIARATPSAIKAFISRGTDHFRVPYGRRAYDFPRECIFAGSVNHPAYLRDETGGRRFWPVVCGPMSLDLLRRDRDQLWAEAVARYKLKERWWLDTPELLQEAEFEQSQRYDDDPWEEPIRAFLATQSSTSVSQVLGFALDKEVQHWTQQDKNRVAKILQRLNWERYRKRAGSGLEWRYRPSKAGKGSLAETNLPSEHS
jgi:hypothetical protein